MLASAGTPLEAAPRAARSRPASGSRVRGYHKELSQRLDGDLLVEELLAAKGYRRPLRTCGGGARPFVAP